MWRSSQGANGNWTGGFSRSLTICNAYITAFGEVYEGLKYANCVSFTGIEVNVDSEVLARTIDQGSLRTHMGGVY